MPAKTKNTERRTDIDSKQPAYIIENIGGLVYGGRWYCFFVCDMLSYFKSDPHSAPTGVIKVVNLYIHHTMAYEQNFGEQERKEYDVDEKCAKCGAEIKKLPFPPNPERRDTLQCKDCWRKERSSRQER